MRLAKIKDSKIETYHTDYLGTPKEVTDESGAIVWRSDCGKLKILAILKTIDYKCSY